MMEKMKLHSPNLTQENIARIRELFPNCVTEAQSEDGKLRLAVDFDQLRQELSESIVEGPQERYHLNWPGKREALLTANAPIAKTLRPCREESVDFDTTKNLFIEGDNLEALKLLQETYLGKVKMIYIDPPYNTGNDFIYEDDFAENAEEYLKRSNQKDEEGNHLIANTESNGRFHSDWLSMMYIRLRLSKHLLSESGVICISIDDHEVDNLRKICDEVFGGGNYVATIANTNNPKGRSDDKFIATAHEYIVIYARNLSDFRAFGFKPGDEIIRRYNKIDVNGEIYREIDLRKTGDNDLREDRPNLFYYFYYNQETKHLFPSKSEETPDGFIQIRPLRADGKEGNWRWGLDTAQERIQVLDAKYMPNREVWGIMEKDYLRNRDRVKATSSWTFKDVNSERGSEEFISLGFDKRIFPKPKPIGTIRRLIEICCSEKGSDIILDYFAGSATAAHAALQINAETGGNRKFIMVQLPESCDEKSDAFKAGYKTIAEMSKERIRRAGKKILEGECQEGWSKDIGFRVLKIDSSNMADVYYTPDAIDQTQVDAFVDNIKPDRSPEDMLFQVLLDWGVDLSLPIRKETLQGKTVFFVDGNALVACFDTGVNEDVVKELARFEPLRIVFRDTGFVSDAVKINVEQIFRQMSPGTDVKSI